MFTGLEMRAQWNHLEPTPGLKHYLCEHSVWGIDCMIKTIPNPSIHYIMCTYPLESNYTHTHHSYLLDVPRNLEVATGLTELPKEVETKMLG